MEACGSAHYLARFCQQHNHVPMILHAELTNALTHGNKDDHNDAHVIWQSSNIPNIKLVRVRSESNQITGMLLKQGTFV